jgi:hypothetical protein
MKIKIVLMLSILFAGILYSSEKKEHNMNVVIPSYKELIGKKFVDIKELDSMLVGGPFTTLYTDKKYAVSIYGPNKSTIESKYNYVFFTKEIGRQDRHAIEQILDIVPVDMNKFNDSARIWLDECYCVGQKSCQTIAIYHHDQTMAEKGIMVKPLKVWRPDIATGKLEEISPDSVRCGSQAPEEE